MGLQDKLREINKDLREKGISIDLRVTDDKVGLLKRKKVLTGYAFTAVKVEDDIETAAQIERVMRDSIGYGKFTRDYDVRTKVLKGTFNTLEPEEVEMVSRSFTSRTPRVVYRTGGSNK